MKYLKTYKLFEIADTQLDELEFTKEPFLTLNQSNFWVKIKGKVYMVQIELSGKKEAAIIKIDFMLQVKDIISKDSYSDIKTNYGNPLEVMANVVGVFKYWLSQDMKQSFSGEIVNSKDMNIVGLWIGAKSEEEGDARRANIYDYFLKKNLKNIGIDIIEKKDITKIAPPEMSGVGTPNRIILNQYKITPITIEKIRDRL
jgi:hypothetical protein